MHISRIPQEGDSGAKQVYRAGLANKLGVEALGVQGYRAPSCLVSKGPRGSNPNADARGRQSQDECPLRFLTRGHKLGIGAFGNSSVGGTVSMASVTVIHSAKPGFASQSHFREAETLPPYSRALARMADSLRVRSWWSRMTTLPPMTTVWTSEALSE